MRYNTDNIVLVSKQNIVLFYYISVYIIINIIFMIS